MLVKALVLSCLALASGPLLAAECAATVDSTDMMTFSTESLTVSKSCKTFTLTLTHSGSLPRQVMGHNWVLAKQADAAGVASDGMTAGLDNGYLKPDDSRIIAHTRLIGGGEQDTVKFDVNKLDTGEQYQFICTYPGHIAMMKGTLKLVD